MQLPLLFASLIGMQMALVTMQMPSQGRQTRPAERPRPELFDGGYGMPELIDEDDMPELYGSKQARGGDKEEHEHEEEDEEYEEKAWKWEHAYPCRVDNATATIMTKACPMDLQCNMGPVTVNAKNASLTVRYCALPGKFMLFHACHVMKEGKVVKENDLCTKKGGRCNVGPLDIQTEGETVTAKFCNLVAMGMPDGFKNATKEMKRAVRACRLEDENGNDLVQRPCPDGFKCTKGPMVASWEEKDVHAHFCEMEEPEEEEWKWSLEETIQYMVKEKSVAPGIVLAVMHHMVENGKALDPKKVFEYAMEQAAKMKGHGGDGGMGQGGRGDGGMGQGGHGGMDGGRGDMGGDKGGMQMSPEIQAMMHKLHHAHMWQMEQSMREGDMDHDDMGRGMGGMGGMEGMGGRRDHDDMGRGMGGRRDGDDMKDMLQMVMRQAQMAKKEASEKKEDIMEFMKKMIMLKGMMAQAQPKNDMEDIKKMMVLMAVMGQQQPKPSGDGELIKMVMEMMKMKMGGKMGKDHDEDHDEDHDHDDMEGMMKKMKGMMEGKKEGKKDMGDDMEDMMKKMKMMMEGKGGDDMDFTMLNQLKMMMEGKGGDDMDFTMLKQLKMMMEGKGGDMKDMMKKLKGGEGEGDLYMILRKMEQMFEASGMREEDIPEPIMEMIHYLHHAHLWESEKKMRAQAGIGQTKGDGPAEGLFMLLRKMEQMFEASGMSEEDIPEPVVEMIHYLHHAHMWEVEKQMREEAKRNGDKPAPGAELYMLLRKMEMMFEASGMKKEDIPEPIAEMMHYLHHAHLWDIEKQMREDEKPSGKKQGDLYMLLSKMEQMFKASGMKKEDIPEPIAELMHVLHHKHMWESEKRYRATGKW